MSANIPGWSPEIERGFKEILFRFLEEIQCTRAALYLYGPGDKFLLATQYGVGRRDVLAIEHGLHDPMVRRVRELKGVPTAFNRKQNLGPLTDYLKSAGNSRLLLVPLIAGEEIIGFIDARDKGLLPMQKKSPQRWSSSRSGQGSSFRMSPSKRSKMRRWRRKRRSNSGRPAPPCSMNQGSRMFTMRLSMRSSTIRSSRFR